jgi:hypothetical protein
MSRQATSIPHRNTARGPLSYLYRILVTSPNTTQRKRRLQSARPAVPSRRYRRFVEIDSTMVATPSYSRFWCTPRSNPNTRAFGRSRPVPKRNSETPLLQQLDVYPVRRVNRNRALPLHSYLNINNRRRRPILVRGLGQRHPMLASSSEPSPARHNPELLPRPIEGSSSNSRGFGPSVEFFHRKFTLSQFSKEERAGITAGRLRGFAAERFGGCPPRFDLIARLLICYRKFFVTLALILFLILVLRPRVANRRIVIRILRFKPRLTND